MYVHEPNAAFDLLNHKLRIPLSSVNIILWQIHLSPLLDKTVLKNRSIINMFNQSPTDNHILLIKSIVEKYVDICFKPFATIENERATYRQQLTKAVIFTGN